MKSILSRRLLILLGIIAISKNSRRASAETEPLVISISLPTDRAKAGILTLKTASGISLIDGLGLLGKSDNQRAVAEGNPNREPTIKYGDTPEGQYAVPRVVDTGQGTAFSKKSYGPHAAIVLDPVAGEALTAKNNGRTGLLIHSGDAGPKGGLRATHGCLRLSNDDMKKLLQAIANHSANPVFNRCDVVRLSVLVGTDSEEGPGNDEDDPPPGIDALLQPQPIVIP